MCGIIGYVGSRECRPCCCTGWSASSTAATTPPGSRSSRTTASTTSARRQPLLSEGGGGRPERLPLEHGARPHALGHPRRRHRAQRPPAHGLRAGQDRDRPERHRRELPRAARAAQRRGAHVHLGDRRRDGRPPDRAALRRRPARGGAPRGRRARGPLHLRRHPPRPPGRARATPCRRRSWSGSARARCSWRRTPPRSCARRATSCSPTTVTSSASRRRARSSSTATAGRSSTT